jgi:serine/threonine protein kinase/tetratricopeptide (TPR) repeat protein
MSLPNITNRPSEKEIFFQAIEIATPHERALFLNDACGDDSRLRRRVESLLAQHFEPNSFMQEPAVEVAPATLLHVPLSEGPGTIIGRYKLLEKIGEGGFGVVYVAEQKEPVKRRIALKIIKLGMDTEQVVARFEAERQALALMDHPNIAKVLDAGATETGRPYFVMELVRGVPITQYCDENNLPTLDRLQLFIAVCHAIQHAHQKGIIHRDIKPSNILVTLHDGVPVPKVIDFGIAKATQTELTNKTIYTQFQQFIGTPAYISPEQAEMSGLDIDTRCDIYSLGVLLYELLTGKTPFDAKELVQAGLDEMRRTIREKEPLRPSTRLSGFTPEELTATAKRRSGDAPKLIHALRGDLDWIVMKCLEKDRTRRYETAVGIAADLKRYLQNEPVNARPPSNLYRIQKFVRRHKRGAIAAAAVALALVLGLGLATFAFLRERDARLEQLATEKERKAETVRADAVGAFMGQLLTTTAPELLQQGHQRPVRKLLEAADGFASKALSEAPLAELQLRGMMAPLYLSEGPSLLDAKSSYEQTQRMTELLSRVPDDKLPTPRDVYRLNAASADLWANDHDRGLAKLEALKDEFRGRTPPANDFVAWCLAIEGNWYFWKSEAAIAKEKLEEALRLMPADSPPILYYFVRAYLAAALTDLGKLTEAEQVAREALLPTANVTPDLAHAHAGTLSLLAGILCQQNRFNDAESLLLEQKRVLSANGCPPRDLLLIDKTLGGVCARSGNTAKALPLLMSVATNNLATSSDCAEAACVAIGAGHRQDYQTLCAIGLARFAAGAEGINALSISDMLLAAPQDDVVTQVADDMVHRVENAQDFSKELGVGTHEWFLLRKGQPTKAAALWPTTVNSPPPTAPILARMRKLDYFSAVIGLRSALALAQLDRVEESLEAYRHAVKVLGPAPSAENPRDLGDAYSRWYLAEAHRREVEHAFNAKGIEIPAVPAQSN